MAEGCNNNCAGCKKDCGKRTTEPLNEMSKVKRVIGVVSGKGGVGKSSVTSMLAVLSERLGYSTAILDADITGPSIPRAFGLKERAHGEENMIFPVATKKGIQVMSMNLLLEHEGQPVVWRGPVLAGVVKQFWSDVVWGEVDYMFVDMPPGTGDVPLTVYQSLPIDGIVVVTTPQDLVADIVEKAVTMARMLNIPVIALVENMSYLLCPDCGKKIPVFGESKVCENAKKLSIGLTAQIPVDPDLASQTDKGLIELFEGSFLDNVMESIEKLFPANKD